MAIIDPIRMEILRKVFPEINDIKIEVFTLFAFGMTIREISVYRNTTHQAVYKTLKSYVNNTIPPQMRHLKLCTLQG
ncbi:conjugal transfer protein TraJ [Escherichia coli]|uniref:conjugal transfer protein TraJ n=1 Tax=Escherichia coli TaxID=562 RepID=UPI00300472CA